MLQEDGNVAQQNLSFKLSLSQEKKEKMNNDMEYFATWRRGLTAFVHDPPKY